MASKQERVVALARRKRLETGSTWCVCENGACGPTFNYADLEAGFSAIWVSGPVERGILVRSTHARREDNMWVASLPPPLSPLSPPRRPAVSRWAFSAAALDLLAECVAEAAAAREAGGAPEAEKGAPLLEATEDRHGGVEAEVRPGAPWQVSGLSRSCTAGARPRHVHDTASDGSWQVSGFVEELHSALQAWEGAGKRGLWLRLPAEAHAYVDAAVAAGFEYHHATAGYLQLTRWLPPTPSPLPRYAFTSVGVGGVVVNGKREVLMVQERVSPSKRMQGCTDAQPAVRRGGAEEPSPQPSRRLCAGRGSCRAGSPSQGRTLRRPWPARLPRRRACGRSSTASSACATRTAAASGSPTCTLSCVDCSGGAARRRRRACLRRRW